MKHYLIPQSHSDLVTLKALMLWPNNTEQTATGNVPEAWSIFYIQSMSLIILSLVDVI